MADIVLFGVGEVASVAKYYLDHFSEDRVVGYTVDAAYVREDRLDGLPVVAWENLHERFAPGSVQLLGPLSYQRLNDFRRERHLEGKSRGYDFASFIHPSTHNCAASIGENAFILEGCTLPPYCVVGVGAILWSAVHIGHHCRIGDFVFLSSQVGLSSGVHIEDCCMIGGQVGIINGITVGASSYIESRAVLRRNVPPHSVVRHPFDVPTGYDSDRLKSKKFK